MEPLQALLTVAFGALAGGLTNSIAIWMLFHPYAPPKLGRRRLEWLQGAIPKNQARLAGALGRAVGKELLTPTDIVRALERPPMRAAFESGIHAAAADVLARQRGPLSAELPADAAAALRALLGDVARQLVERLEEFLAGAEFERLARSWADRLAAELADRPIGELLTPAREAALAGAVARWIRDSVDSPGFERMVDEYLTRASERMLEPARTFEDILPTGLVAALEKGIAGYLPIAIERLAGLLQDPDARARVERVLHEILGRFMRDLKFHQRLVAALVITPETVERVLAAVEAEGAAKVAEVLEDPAVQDAMARHVNQAIVDFLRRSVRDVIGAPEDPTVADARRTVRGLALSLARDPQTSGFLVEKMRSALGVAEQRTWAAVFEQVPPERFAEALVAAARSHRAAEIYRDAASALVERLLERPIGRPADFLPPDAAARIGSVLAEPLWAWLIEQAPAAVERIDVAGRVEEKVLAFDPARVEQLVRNVTQRELKLIVRLGYLLGGLIGSSSVGLSLLLR